MLNTIRVSGMAVGAAMLLAMSVSQVQADTTDKKTVLTFGATVEVPGMVLQPGAYVFKLADDQIDRNIVEIFDQSQTHLFTTILTVPDYRSEPPDQFEEREANGPQAIHAWFYPGDTIGVEFVYPKLNASTTTDGRKPVAHHAD